MRKKVDPVRDRHHGSRFAADPERTLRQKRGHRELGLNNQRLTVPAQSAVAWRAMAGQACKARCIARQRGR